MASIEIAAGWIDAVQRHIEGLMVDAQLAADNATQYLHDAVKARARGDEQWSSLADNISVWSQDGRLIIGFQDPMFMSQAMLVEYGDLDNPPNPLFRTMSSEVRNAHQMMQQDIDDKYGPRMSVGSPKITGMTS